jgi:hypothetical protein
MATTTTTTYKYAGHGWDDPLAQEVYQKYSPGVTQPGPGGGPSAWDQLMSSANAYGQGQPRTNFFTPVDPYQWNTHYFGEPYSKMAAEYEARGGMGTYGKVAEAEKAAADAEAAATAAAGGSYPGSSGSEYSIAPSIEPSYDYYDTSYALDTGEEELKRKLSSMWQPGQVYGGGYG